MHTRNQWTLYAVWAVACLPLLAAMLMYFGKVAVPDGRANHGELLAPGTSLQQLGLQADLPRQFTEPRWLLLITAPEQCHDRCQTWLHQLRQIKTALGRDTERVEFRLVQPDHSFQPPHAAANPGYLHQASLHPASIHQSSFNSDPFANSSFTNSSAGNSYEDKISLYNNTLYNITGETSTPNIGTVPRLISSHGDYQAAIWVADPLGNLVLRYDLNETPRALLDDLKRLLKVSKIG